MARKHRHQEHINHERWIVSFADMMTLLFALFVVLYAMGVADLAKLEQIKKSVQFAFNIAGDGKTRDAGIFNQQSGAGDVPEIAPLVTAQDGEMREFLRSTLLDYEEIAGRSLEFWQTDDAVTLTTPVADFFDAYRSGPIKREIRPWLDKMLAASLSFTSEIVLRIETPNVPIGTSPTGRALTSLDLAHERLKTMQRSIAAVPGIHEWVIETALRVQREKPGLDPAEWEKRAVVVIVLSNRRRENR